jgi:hypothetical protein
VARKKLTKIEQDRLGIKILIGVAVVIALVVIVAVLGGKGPDGGYDQDTLCPRKQPYAHSIILIDKTDLFSTSQQTVLVNIIGRVRDRMEEFEKLSIFVLDDRNYGSAVPVFALCNPGRGDNFNPLYQNPELARRIFDTKFGQPLKEVLKVLTVGGKRPTSPIMEMIRAISVVEDFAPKGAKARRLILFSDMLHNTPSFSQYQNHERFSKFRTTDYARRAIPNLSGVDVEIIYLLRDGAGRHQTRGHAIFWEHYFNATGARLQDLVPTP